MRISVCTTNYNCAHALRGHLESVYRNLRGLDFEYIVTDNRSRDSSRQILTEWSNRKPNMKLLTARCTMGEGRQIAFWRSKGTHIMVLDTDVIYSDLLRKFTDVYLANYSDKSVQAIYCGIFPREHWLQAGGRRSLNTNEDVDMWLRILRAASIRWYPVSLGENVKEP